MDKFTTHTGRVLPLRRSNVDTDQIIPAVYLKRITRDGFEDGLFAAWRKDPDFVLNRPEYARSHGSGGRARSSAPDPRVSTRCGRCRTTGSASSSRRGSPTSSGATASRVGCSTVELPEEVVERLVGSWLRPTRRPR